MLSSWRRGAECRDSQLGDSKERAKLKIDASLSDGSRGLASGRSFDCMSIQERPIWADDALSLNPGRGTEFDVSRPQCSGSCLEHRLTRTVDCLFVERLCLIFGMLNFESLIFGILNFEILNFEILIFGILSFGIQFNPAEAAGCSEIAFFRLE